MHLLRLLSGSYGSNAGVTAHTSLLRLLHNLEPLTRLFRLCAANLTTVTLRRLLRLIRGSYSSYISLFCHFLWHLRGSCDTYVDIMTGLRLLRILWGSCDSYGVLAPVRCLLGRLYYSYDIYAALARLCVSCDPYATLRRVSYAFSPVASIRSNDFARFIVRARFLRNLPVYWFLVWCQVLVTDRKSLFTKHFLKTVKFKSQDSCKDNSMIDRKP